MDCTQLSSLIWQDDCRLSTIGDRTFCRCSSLQSICLPAALCQVTGLAMVESGIRNVTVDSRNRFFRVSGDFLLDFNESCVVRYFGHDPEVSIGNDIKILATGCFSYCASLLSVRFARDSTVATLGDSAFRCCASLQSICIPSSSTEIADACFCNCGSLSSFTFEPGCKISLLGEAAFKECASLQSICIPASTEIIRSRCLSSCTSLSSVTFEPGSKLLGLGELVFGDCSSLQSICLPASIIAVSPLAFKNCRNLVKITLEAEAQLSASWVQNLARTCHVSLA
jgi:hypothetical protein